VYRALGSVLACLPSASSGNPEEINLFEIDDIYTQQEGDDTLRDRVLDLAHTIKECHLSQEEAQAMMMVIGLESLGNIPHLTMYLLSRAVAGSPRVEHVQLQGASEQPLINVTLEGATGCRLDCLACPEFYVSITREPLRVSGRFSDEWFPGGSSATPCVFWITPTRLRVASPRGEFVCVVCFIS
jgi:hypothetical protein